MTGKVRLGEKINFSDPVPGSPDDMANRLLGEIAGRETDLRFLQAYLEGAPFSPGFNDKQGMEQNALDRLKEMSRMNYASVIVAATTDRLGLDGFRTAVNSDETGDEEAMKAFNKDEMNIRATYGIQLACSYRSSYLVVDPISKRQSIIPPTNAAVINDIFGEPIAALTLQRDRFLDRDILKLYLRDQDEETGEAKGNFKMFVASRESKNDKPPQRRIGQKVKPYSQSVRVTNYDTEVPLTRQMKNGWEWWKVPVVDFERIPVTPLVNKDGKAEFEDHTDAIDRAHYGTFQRLLIITMQALKQRAIQTEEGKPIPRTTKEGEVINYDKEFSAEPGAVWVLPEGASMWESSSTDISSIHQATRDDIKDLFSQSFTNMAYLSDSVNQSAAGANNQQEGYTSKIEDRRRRFASRLARHMSIYFEITGDIERSDVSKLEVIWPPVKIESLTDRSASYAGLVTAGFPQTSAMREALKLTPDEIRRVEQEAYEERINQIVENNLSGVTPLESNQAQSSGNTTGKASIGGNSGTAQDREQSASNRKG